MNARTTLWVALIAPLLTQQVNAADADKDHQHKAKAAEKQLKQQSKQKIAELKPVPQSGHQPDGCPLCGTALSNDGADSFALRDPQELSQR